MASDAVPIPASTITGTFDCFIINEILIDSLFNCIYLQRFKLIIIIQIMNLPQEIDKRNFQSFISTKASTP